MNAATMVWTPGSSGWMPAGQVPGLTGYFAASTPPPPPAAPPPSA
ncbi:MAG: GYF domain-containing protein [Phycisphaerae bacterium]